MKFSAKYASSTASGPCSLRLISASYRGLWASAVLPLWSNSSISSSTSFAYEWRATTAWPKYTRERSWAIGFPRARWCSIRSIWARWMFRRGEGSVAASRTEPEASTRSPRSSVDAAAMACGPRLSRVRVWVVTESCSRAVRSWCFWVASGSSSSVRKQSLGRVSLAWVCIDRIRSLQSTRMVRTSSASSVTRMESGKLETRSSASV